MYELLETYLPPVLGLSAVAYAALAVRVARSTPQNPNNIISIFLFLIAGLSAGSAFSFGTTDPNLYGIGGPAPPVSLSGWWFAPNGSCPALRTLRQTAAGR